MQNDSDIVEKYNVRRILYLSNYIAFALFIFWFVFYPYIGEIYQKQTMKLELSNISEPNLEYLFSLSNKSNSIRLRDANLALEGKYSFQNSSSNYTVLDEDKLSSAWNSEAYVFGESLFDSNTHAFQAHSLFILSDLIYAYTKTSNKDYLYRGIQLFNSWYENNPRFNLFPSHYSWGDHSTAHRLVNVISLFYYVENEQSNTDVTIVNETLEAFISSSLSFLSANHNYSYKNNHGIFQDVAILYALQLLKEQEYYTVLASKRLLAQVSATYSEKNIHMENSPGYHITITNLIKFALSFKLLENEYLSKLNEKISRSLTIGHLLVDNVGNVAPIGDTPYPVQYSDINFHRNQDKPQTDFTTISDTASGYSIYKNQRFYLFVKHTSKLATHSHKDDGTFIFGFDEGLIVSEVGFLDYTSSTKNKITKGRESHNSLILYDFKNRPIDYYCFLEKMTPERNFLNIVSVCNDRKNMMPLYKRSYLYKDSGKNQELLISQKIISSKVKKWEQPVQLEKNTGDVAILATDVSSVVKINEEAVLLVNEGVVKKVIATDGIGYYAKPFDDLYPHNVLSIEGNNEVSSLYISNLINSEVIPIKLLEENLENLELRFKEKPRDFFIKETRNLQILFDIRVLILLVFIFSFLFNLLLIKAKVFKTFQGIITVLIFSNIFINSSLQVYLAFRVFDL